MEFYCNAAHKVFWILVLSLNSSHKFLFHNKELKMKTSPSKLKKLLVVD